MATEETAEQSSSNSHVEPVPLEFLPDERRGMVGPEGPPPLRMMAARGMLPLEPTETVSVLCYLAGCGVEALENAARASILEIPQSVLEAALSNPDLAGPVLHCAAQLVASDSERLLPVLFNASTPDRAFVELARRLKDPSTLQVIAQNEARCIRVPELVVAVYLNDATPMSAATRIAELAARSGLELTQIPGWDEIKASALGIDGVVAEEPTESPEELDLTFQELTRGEHSAVDLDPRELEKLAKGEGTDEAGASASADEPADDDSRRLKAIWVKLKELTIPQRCRLAVVGDSTARRYLIRDPRLGVAISVLQNPKIRESEITLYAQQKSLAEDIIRVIARNREWTKNYQTRLALVRNPKTPTAAAMSFMSMLHEKDVRLLQRDKEVPGYIQKQAGQFLARRERKRR